MSEVENHNNSGWKALIDLLEAYVRDTVASQEESLKTHKLRFAAFFSMTLRNAGMISEQNSHQLDSMLDIYLKHLIAIEENANVIELYGLLSNQQIKIDGVAYFLANIQKRGPTK